jgi:hypothetical protein
MVITGVQGSANRSPSTALRSVRDEINSGNHLIDERVWSTRLVA